MNIIVISKKFHESHNFTQNRIYIWERIWEKGPIGNVFTDLIEEKLPFQMLQTILKYS